jgi:hypothetical protein
MTTLIKLFYAAAIAALLVLLVAFGIRTFYAAPKQPQFPEPPASIRGRFAPPPPPMLEPGVIPTPTADQLAYEEEQQRFQEEYEVYQEKLTDYRRNVFLVAAIVGVAAIAGGLLLQSRLDAIRLGLVTGGLATILYAVAQAGEDLDEFGSAVIFAVALIGLSLVIGVGYRWLARSEAT